jgi:hypothetical protein
VDDKVYFTSDGKLASYDLKSRKVEIIPDIEPIASLGMTWIEGNKLALLTTRPNRIVIFDPASGKIVKTTKIQIPPEPTPIHYIRCGPDGKVYSGGYLSGGLGVYDPATKKHEQLGPLSQTEGIGVLGNRLYFGIYPHARLTWFDTAKPWNPKAENPHQFDHLDRVEQDRPFGVMGIESLNKVFYGTVPDYGKLGGVLAVVDGKTDEVETYRNIIKDQSIVSLTFANGQVIGGTSTSGGLGIQPTAKEAQLFFWDPATKQVTYSTVPVPGATLITGLIIGPDKNVWGIADGTLFVFDLAVRKVTYSKKAFDVDPEARHANWRDATMLLHPSGQIYGTTGNNFFQVDPATKEITILRNHDATLLTVDQAGRLYFRDKTRLWQYTP